MWTHPGMSPKHPAICAFRDANVGSSGRLERGSPAGSERRRPYTADCSLRRSPIGNTSASGPRSSLPVLDMGTGSGVNAILAATKGAQVLAVDINPQAVKAARANAERNGVAHAVEVRASDVFSEVEGRFDVIVFDPPFRWFRPRSLLEAAMTDEGYRAMTNFFRNARQHLAAGGTMLIFFGTSGDLGYLQNLLEEEGFSSEVVAHDQLESEGWGVEYFTFRVT
jgi:release factor glutamine methyltransferase